MMLTEAADAVVELSDQTATREKLLNGMGMIIRRMTRLSSGGVLCLCDHDERELSIALYAYLQGKHWSDIE